MVGSTKAIQAITVMMFNRREALVTSVAALATPCFAGNSGAEEYIARIERGGRAGGGELAALPLDELMQRLGVPGISIAVIRDWQIHWSKSYGVRDSVSRAPVTADTRFQAASISKPITAMAVLRLAQEGKIRLDEDVNAYLRHWTVKACQDCKGKPVTPRSLLAHVAGADDGFGFPGYPPSARLPTTVDILEGRSPSVTKAVSFTRPPYEGYKYSGGSYVVLQQMLTDLTGRPFADLMHDLVLRPLGMENSRFEQPPSSNTAALAATAHSGDGKRMDQPWHIYPELSAAGLWTTAADLAAAVIEVQRAVKDGGGKVLRPQMAREMLSPVGVGPFGAGVRLVMIGDGWYFYHGGSNWGFEAHIRGHLHKGYGVAIMTNAQESGATLINEMGSRLAEAYGWDGASK